MKTKYPRTPHFSWSPGKSSDDKTLKSTQAFWRERTIVTLKMDGENSSLYRDGFHARSLDSRSHPSQDWLRKFHADRAYLIPEGWRICGENMYATHSIHYTGLPSFFLGFSVWNDKNECLSWDDTLKVFADIGIERAPLLYDNEWDEPTIRLCGDVMEMISGQEGYVARIADGFEYGAFGSVVAKCVRKGHVQTTDHWKSQPIMPNELAIALEMPLRKGWTPKAHLVTHD